MYCACCGNKVESDKFVWIGLHSYRDVIHMIDMEEYDIGGTYKDCEIEREVEYPFCYDCLTEGWEEPIYVDGREWWCDYD